MKINMAGVEARRGGGMLPEGSYIARIVEASWAQTDKPAINVTFEVIEGPETGGRVRDTIWLTPKALSLAKWRMECVGITVPDGDMEITPPLFERRVCRIAVVHRERRNDPERRKFPEVKAWDALETAQAEPDPFRGPAADDDDDIPF